MAITIGNTSSSGDPGTAQNSYNWPHTCQAGTNLLVVLPRALETTDADRPVSGITYGGSPLTSADSLQDNALNMGAEVWYLESPTTGSSLTIEITHAGKVTDPSAGAIDLKGVDLLDIVEAVDKQSGTATSIALSVATGDGVVATEVVSNSIDTELGVTGGTQIESVDMGSYSGQSGYDLADLALTFTHTDSEDYCAILMSFNAVAAVNETVTPAAFALALTQETPSVTIDCTVTPDTLQLALTQETSTTAWDSSVSPTTFALALTQEAPSLVLGVTVTPTTFELALTLTTPTVAVPTKLLLHFNGTDGSQTFEDSSDSDHTMGYVGTAQLDIDWKKFGPTSLLLPNGTNYITSADHADWDIGTDNWTFEMWARWRVTPTGISVGLFNRYTDDNNLFEWAISAAGKTFIYVVIGGTTKCHYDVSWVPTLETVYHLTIVRSGTNIYFFVNGISQTLTEHTAVGTNNLDIADEGIAIGFQERLAATLDGHIDEFRFSTVARWTSNFTPPIHEYNSGTVTPDTFELALAQQTPTVVIDCTVTPTTFELALTQETPSLAFDVTVTPAEAALALTLETPSVTAGIVVTPDTFALALTQETVGVAIDCTITPATFALALGQPAPTATADATATPSTFELTLTLPAPTVVWDSSVTPVTFELALALHAPTIITVVTTTVTPAAFELALTQPTPEVSIFYVDIPPFIEKDLIDPYSGGAWLWLVAITIPGNVAVRLARNTEDVAYDGNLFKAFNLRIGKQTLSSDGSIPRLTLQVHQDNDRQLEDMINEAESMDGAQVKLIRTNEKFVDTPVADLEADFAILNTESDDEWVTLILGMPSPLLRKIPVRIYSSKQCPYAVPALFSGPECQYVGLDTTCTGLLSDCITKGNEEHWGGELGLDPNALRV